MFPVRYELGFYIPELGFYIPEDGILHSHRLENPRSYSYYSLTDSLVSTAAPRYVGPAPEHFSQFCSRTLPRDGIALRGSTENTFPVAV
jgi:hypothetical protein